MKKNICKFFLAKIESINPWLIIGVALIARTLFLVVFCITTKWVNYSPLQEPTLIHTGVDGYVQIAHTLLTSGEYALEPNGSPVSFRPPIQPLLMLIFGAWTAKYWYVVWLVCSTMLGVATVWLMWQIAKMTKMSPLITRVLLLICALHPYLIFAARVPGIPSALIFMTTLVLYSTIKCINNNGKYSFLAGIAWGFAILTHGCFLPLFIPACLYAIISLKGAWSFKVRKLSNLFFATMFVVSPWTLRNWITFNRFIPVATGGALQYWIADYVYFHSDVSNKDPISESFKQISLDFEKENHRKLNQSHGGVISLEDDDLLSQKAKKQVFSEPTILLSRFVKGFILFWVTMDRGIIKTIVVSLINIPFLIAALCVTYMTSRKRCITKEYLFAVLFVLTFWGLFAMVQAVGPYFVAITPCLFFIICYGMNLLSNHKSLS